MLKLSSVKQKASDEGEWVDIVDWPGVRLKVRPTSSRDYQIAHGLLIQKLIKALGRLPTSPEMEPALGRLFARHLLRGWEGIAGADDAPLIYTPEVALEQLTDPEMSALNQQVAWAASRVGDTDAEFTADAVKNSPVPSATI